MESLTSPAESNQYTAKKKSRETGRRTNGEGEGLGGGGEREREREIERERMESEINGNKIGK